MDTIKFVSTIDGGHIQIPQRKALLSEVVSSFVPSDVEDGSPQEVMVNTTTFILKMVEEFFIHVFAGNNKGDVSDNMDKSDHSPLVFKRQRLSTPDCDGGMQQKFNT